MSRIHEALKRAEQEQNQGLQQSSVLSPISTNAPSQRSVTVDALPLDPVELVPDTQEAFESNGDLELVLQNLPQREWTPDLKRMLFMDRTRHYGTGMEEFRTLRSRLYRLREKTPTLQAIMVASALPAEGKTFVSANLAQALVRQHGRRVLLIDADVRKPHMHDTLGTYGSPGLIDYLAGDVEKEAILQRSPLENLFFIPGGTPASNTSELIGNGRFASLIAEFKSVFHWIVVDSSPVIPVTDATLVAPVCDGVLLVVQADGTPVELAQRARQEFKSVPVLGVVLNRSQEQPAKSSYYYSYGRYGKPEQVVK